MKKFLIIVALLGVSPAWAIDGLPSKMQGKWCRNMDGYALSYSRWDGDELCGEDWWVYPDREEMMWTKNEVNIRCTFSKIRKIDQDTYILNESCKELYNDDSPEKLNNVIFKLINGRLFTVKDANWNLLQEEIDMVFEEKDPDGEKKDSQQDLEMTILKGKTYKTLISGRD